MNFRMQLTANLTGKVRTEKDSTGKDWLVAPLTLIVPGVLNGSKGPLYYSPEEIERSVDSWNGVPIVINHPKKDGKHVSARNPNVVSIGIVYRSTFKNKLMAEGWFDPDKTKEVDERVLHNLRDSIPTELSTGLGVDSFPAEPAAVDPKGIPYTSIATNFRPDHLAILPDDKGACSLEDGCGVLVNYQSDEKETDMAKLNKKQRSDLIDEIIANCGCPDTDKEVLGNLSDEALQATQLTYKEIEKLTLNNKQLEAVANAAKLGFEDQGGNTHVYNEEEKRWETTPKKEDKPENKKGDETIKNSEKELKPKTYEEWMEEAPEEVRAAVENSRKIETREKRKLVDGLMQHIEDEEARAKLNKRLMGKPLVELEELSLLSPKVEETAPVENYQGMGSPPANNQSSFDKTDILGIPTMEYETAK